MLDDLDLLVEQAMAEWRIPGLAIAVVQPDEPILVRGFGEREVEAALPVTTETQFILCSITKSFTATGLAMLAEERRLDWSKPVREYMAEFRLHDPIAGHALIQWMATSAGAHRCGRFATRRQANSTRRSPIW